MMLKRTTRAWNRTLELARFGTCKGESTNCPSSFDNMTSLPSIHKAPERSRTIPLHWCSPFSTGRGTLIRTVNRKKPLECSTSRNSTLTTKRKRCWGAARCTRPSRSWSIRRCWTRRQRSRSCWGAGGWGLLSSLFLRKWTSISRRALRKRIRTWRAWESGRRGRRSRARRKFLCKKTPRECSCSSRQRRSRRHRSSRSSSRCLRRWAAAAAAVEGM
mmetsp:Transcript_57715/g.118051  ORF Transcript_57715/g.118051 Transcript_57715/m.118051 type:complete len:217 (-) Transcript_57715:7-657(-)